VDPRYSPEKAARLVAIALEADAQYIGKRRRSFRQYTAEMLFEIKKGIGAKAEDAANTIAAEVGRSSRTIFRWREKKPRS
jgi:hypothetical protein